MTGIETTLRRLLRAQGLDVIAYRPEKSYAAAMQRLLERSAIELVLDVGANIGQYAKWLRSIGYRSRIVSFEPLQVAYGALERASAGDPLWTVMPRCALGAEDMSVRINVSENSQSSSIRAMLPAHLQAAPESRYVGYEEVRMHTLDGIASGLLEGAGQVLLKIDTQGYEDQVLAGARQLLARVRAVQLELSLAPLYEGQLLMCEMMKRMQALGLDCHLLWPGFVDASNGRVLQMDAVFVRQ